MPTAVDLFGSDSYIEQLSTHLEDEWPSIAASKRGRSKQWTF